MKKDNRNKNITQMYLDGQTTNTVAAKFKISPARIRQILHKQGVVLRKPKKQFCIDCRTQLCSGKNTHSNHNRCFDCIKKRKKIHATLWSPYHGLKACTECGENTSEHQSKGVCERCYGRERYKDPEYRKKHLISMNLWIKKNRKKHLANMRVYGKKYYEKNKKEASMYRLLIRLMKADAK